MYKRIMVVVDEGPAALAAIDEGLRLAGAHDGELTFVAVLPRAPRPIGEPALIEADSAATFERLTEARAGEGLAAAVAAAERAGVMSRALMLPGDDPVGQIVEAARKRRCDLIAIGADGHNAFVRLVTGSLVSGLITRSPLPVLVCKAAEQAGAVLPARHRLRPRSRRRAGIDLHH